MDLPPTANHALGDAGPWTLWRDIVLRGTGFDVALLELLGSPALSIAASRHLNAADQRDRHLQQARQICRACLQSTAPGPVRRAWNRAKRQLQAGQVPAPMGDAAFDLLLAQLLDSQAIAIRSAADFDRAYVDADRQAVSHLRGLAADPRFREAIAWQNPIALQSALAPLLRHSNDLPLNAQNRRHAELVALYLQRYAVKNDTIGFFGPVGWARIQDPGSRLDLQAGPSLAQDPWVDIEPWAVQALADALTREADLRPHLRPWRHPSWRAGPDDTVVVLEHVFRLAPLERALFERCDGDLTVANLPRALGVGVDETEAALRRLEAARLVFLAPRIPLDGPALHRLRGQLDRLPEGQARTRWLAGLDALQAGTEAAAQCFGQGDAVAGVQDGMATHFTALSGQPALRLHGSTHAGRTLLVMDARRGQQMHIGEGLALDLMAALRPVLDAAYWFSCQVHAQFTEFATSVFDQGQRGGQMPLDRWWFDMQREGNTVQAIVADVAEQLAERWAVVLPADDPEPAADASEQAAAAFADVAPGWPGARFQAPDVMLAAADASEAADALFVLGELHAADRSLLRQVFVSAHLDPQRLVDAVRHDQTEPELRPLLRTEAMLARMQVMPSAPYAFDIECDSIISPQPATRVLRSGALWLQRRDGELRIVDREQGHDFPLRTFLGPQAGALSSSDFKLYAPAPYRPRRQAGRLVVARESWRLEIQALCARLGTQRGSTAQRYAAVRRLARDLGWPRRLFYRVAGEPKPIYLDLDSPVYVNVFLRTLAAAARRGDPALEVSEMLPGPEHCWLPDAAGARYACEWRMLFVRRPPSA